MNSALEESSAWTATPSFFPQFIHAIRDIGPEGEHLVAGAADGKFVAPLLAQNRRVVAIERDERYVHGTHDELVAARLPGLQARFAREIAEDSLEVLSGDYMETPGLHARFASVFTSCSWHYSCNSAYELAEIVGRLQSFVAPGGWFGADFMLSIPGETPVNSRYPDLADVVRLFPDPWDTALALETLPFVEAGHIDNPDDHLHKLGFIATRLRKDTE